MGNFLAQNIFGSVSPPPGVIRYGGGALSGITPFISNILRFMVVIAGIWAVLNIILAGYAFMSAGDDPKKMENAWAKIWQTLLGLAVATGAFILAAIFGILLFRDPNALLQLRIFSPN